MTPKLGGEPLPPSPICLPRDYRTANLYLVQIQKALGRKGWSKEQRRRLRDLLRKWTLRAEGRDEYFQLYGTFRRIWGAPSPTPRDLAVEIWRRASHETSEERIARKKRERWPRRFKTLANTPNAKAGPIDPRFRSKDRLIEFAEEMDKDEE